MAAAAQDQRMRLSFLVEYTPEERNGAAEPEKKEPSKKSNVPPECPTCSKACKFKAELLYHEWKHGINKKIIVCERCKLGFRKKYTYVDHIRGVHNKEKRYPCDKCNRAFFFRKDIVKHKLAVHEEVKPHLCTYCQRSFSKLEHLRRHAQSIHERRSVSPAR